MTANLKLIDQRSVEANRSPVASCQETLEFFFLSCKFNINFIPACFYAYKCGIDTPELPRFLYTFLFDSLALLDKFLVACDKILKTISLHLGFAEHRRLIKLNLTHRTKNVLLCQAQHNKRGYPTGIVLLSLQALFEKHLFTHCTLLSFFHVCQEE